MEQKISQMEENVRNGDRIRRRGFIALGTAYAIMACAASYLVGVSNGKTEKTEEVVKMLDQRDYDIRFRPIASRTAREHKESIEGRLREIKYLQTKIQEY